MKKVSVLLVDDHSMVRLGLRTIVERLDDIDIVAEAENGVDALAIIKEQKPDIALLDISMPKMNGLEVAKEVKELKLSTKIIIVSIYHKEEYVMQSIEYGCSGYLLKNTDPEELQLAVKTIMKGEHYYGANISKIMMQTMAQKQKESDAIAKQKLTRREVQVIKLIAEGLQSKEIAAQLFISARTVETHKTNIYYKLDIHNSAQLIRYAMNHNLVKPNTTDNDIFEG